MPKCRRFPSHSPERQKIYHARYRQKHLDRLRQEEREKRAADPQKWKDSKQAWYARNRARILAKDNARRAANRITILRAKDSPCVDCGERYPSYVMDFDHVRGIKHSPVSQMQKHVNPAAIFEEIAKCDLVCANCHRKRTFSRRKLVKPATPWSRKGPWGSGLIPPKRPRRERLGFNPNKETLEQYLNRK